MKMRSFSRVPTLRGFAGELQLDKTKQVHRHRVSPFVSTTALELDTMRDKHVVNLPHISGFFGHLRGAIQQKKKH
jgi:hypothetical protein